MQDQPSQAPHAVAELVDGQAVIIHLRRGIYVSLNETGSFLWERLDGETSLEAIARELAENYDVDITVTRPDVLDLVRELLAEDLITL
ncbi:MAG TPA: PqqD family protein [Caldilineae bacterium]|nr:PqqD family protein [Caldilineae bacterium]